MNWQRLRWKYWFDVFRRRHLQHDLEDEIASHVALDINHRIANGDSPEQARTAALRELRGALSVKEATRDTWAWTWCERLVQDLRYAMRLMGKSPALTVTALLSLAIGIGMNTAIFTLLDTVLLRDLPVQSPDDVVLLAERVGAREGFSLSSPAFRALSESSALAGLAAFRPWRLRLDAAGRSQLANGQLVSGNYFSLLGVAAFRGRTLTDADDRAGADAVAVLSYRFWQRQFGADPGVVGRTLRFQGHPFTVVGISAPEFYGLEPGKEVDITVPLVTQPIVMPGTPLLKSPDARWLRLVGRRRPGISLDQVQANLELRWAQLTAANPPRPGAPESRLQVLPGGQGLYDLRRQFSLPLRVLMSAVAIVLLVACMNLASLLLAKMSARQREIEIRLALGVSRSRLLRQLLTESILLSAIAGILALAIAYWGTPLLVQIMSRGREPLILDLAIHTRTLLFTLFVSALTSVLFGIAPALRATHRLDLHRTRVRHGKPKRWTAALIAAQVGLCLIVLVCAGLLLGSLRHLRQVDAGFRKDHVLLLSIRPALSSYNEQRTAQIYSDLYRRFTELPDVQSVTLSMDTPLGGVSFTAGASIAPEAGLPGEALQVNVNSVGPRFFETMGIPLIRGRDLNVLDDQRAAPVAVITQSVARDLFGDRNPLGRHIEIGRSSMEIVGIAKDALYQNLREPAHPMVYRPYLQMAGSWEELFFAIRTATDPKTILPLVDRALHDAAPDIPIFSLRTLEEQVDATIVRERVVSLLSTWLGAFALLLSAIGIYGRLAHTVVERTAEIGLRMALGAARRVVIWQILREVLVWVLCGIAVGLPLATAAAHGISSLLFGVAASDPSTLSAVVITIAGVALLAAYIPARRASLVDPVRALKYE